ncbi:hypothetical protein [Bradyrhizobium oligotrophicum]|uniref:hypothetical protein n=1 Tax=Bradyrhizobium oligotrophicum TaxID=44255 RepID=UPI003EBCDC71
MLRFKVLVSAVPLIAAAVIARLELAPSPQPCIAVGADSVSLGSAPFTADLHVDVTDDPALATIRVALADSPETADFVVVDDVLAKEDRGCGMTAATAVVAIAADPHPGALRIHLAKDSAADAHAAALIVSARSHDSPPADPVL